MTDVSHSDNSIPDDLIAAYALDALSREERAQVDALLASSEEARAALRDYQAMLTGFATLAPPRKAPAHLTSDFRQRLAAEAGTPQVGIPERRSIPQLIQRRPWVFALAAVLVVVVAGVALFTTLTANNQQRLIDQILANGNAQRVVLAPQQGATGTVTLVTLPDTTQAVLVAQLPDLPTEKQYQLWLIKDNKMESAYVFSIDHPDEKLLLTLPAPAMNYQGAGITVEPRLGSKQPTTNPIFVGSISQ